MKKYAFGVDIGGTTIKMGFFETTGELLEKWEIPTRTEDNGVNILPDIASEIDKKLGEKSIDKSTEKSRDKQPKDKLKDRIMQIFGKG